MQAVILAGGQGTRLRSLYPDRPKALVPVCGKPFLWWQLTWLRDAGITDAHLAGGYMLDAIRKWSASGGPEGIRLTLSEEPEPLGTGGGLKYVNEHLRSDPFLVLNGDSLLPNADFQSLEKKAWVFPIIGRNTPEDFQSLENSESPAEACIVVTRIDEAGRYGTVEFDEAGSLTAFREKAERSGGWINAGIYLMRKKVLDRIPSNQKVSLETETFPSLAAEGRVRVLKADGPLLDMGTPDGLQTMENYLSASA